MAANSSAMTREGANTPQREHDEPSQGDDDPIENSSQDMRPYPPQGSGGSVRISYGSATTGREELMDVGGRVQDTNQSKARLLAFARSNHSKRGTVDEFAAALAPELPGPAAAAGAHAGGSGPPAPPHGPTQAAAPPNTAAGANAAGAAVPGAGGAAAAAETCAPACPAAAGAGPPGPQAAQPSRGSKRSAYDLFDLMSRITKSCRTIGAAQRAAAGGLPAGGLPAQPCGRAGSGATPLPRRGLQARRTGAQDSAAAQDLLPLLPQGQEGPPVQDAAGSADAAEPLVPEVAGAAPAAAAEAAAAPTAGGPIPQPGQPLPPQPVAASQAPRYPGDREKVRYIIQGVSRPNTQWQPFTALDVYSEFKEHRLSVQLWPPWDDPQNRIYREGSAINLLVEDSAIRRNDRGAFVTLGEDCEGTWWPGLLVVHPDHLASATRVADSYGPLGCARRAFLTELVGDEFSGLFAVLGIVEHELVQARAESEMCAQAFRIVASRSEALLGAVHPRTGEEWDEKRVLRDPHNGLLAKVGAHLRWRRTHMPAGRTRRPGDGWGGHMVDRSRHGICITGVSDVEEHINDVKHGLTGKIDATLCVQRTGTHGELTLPLEIKTGKKKDKDEHQARLYQPMLSERRGEAIGDSMLWHTKEGSGLQLVGNDQRRLAELIAARNAVEAGAVSGELPPLFQRDPRGNYLDNCSGCYAKLNCAVAHIAVDGGDGPESWVGPPLDPRAAEWRRADARAKLLEAAERGVGHLASSSRYCSFFTHWLGLILLEERDSAARRYEIWSMTGEERQAKESCLAGLVMVGGPAPVGAPGGGHLYRLATAHGGPLPDLGLLHEGSLLTLSLEGRHAAVAQCNVAACGGAEVTVLLQRPLNASLVEQGTQPGARWRLDADEGASPFQTMRENMFKLIRREHEEEKAGHVVPHRETATSQNAARLRRFIIDHEAPRVPLPHELPALQRDAALALNDAQQLAVRRALAAAQHQDYVLVQGFPGAGKTTAIVRLIAEMVRLNKRVLVSAYTNSAVDNICEKLAATCVPFLRVGAESKVHPIVKPFRSGGGGADWMPQNLRALYSCTKVATLKELRRSVNVFVCTALSLKSHLLRNIDFDMVIVDEATQILMPITVGPLLRAGSFVLVGDPEQLGPLVRCRLARAEASGDEGWYLDVSLFERLAQLHPGAVVKLPMQFRMARDISDVPSRLFYGGEMVCANEEVASAGLRLADPAALAQAPRCIREALDPRWQLALLNTADALHPEWQQAVLSAAGEQGAQADGGNSKLNRGEAFLALALLRAAEAAGVEQQRMGVIAPFNAQCELIKRMCRDAGLADVEVLTVDKCQGRDKDMMILSFTACNDSREPPLLLEDRRRLNVALTRGKHKLLLLGHADTLSPEPNCRFAQLLSMVHERSGQEGTRTQYADLRVADIVDVLQWPGPT